MLIDPTANIHTNSVIEEGAKIGANVIIGPFCHIGSDVTLGAGVELKSHVVISGWTDIGNDTVIFPFSSIGHMPQDLKFNGEVTKLELGAQTKFSCRRTFWLSVNATIGTLGRNFAILRAVFPECVIVLIALASTLSAMVTQEYAKDSITCFSFHSGLR